MTGQITLMINDKIKICLGQKKILLTKILNITKQLEARSKQPHIRYDDLPQQRQIFIDRLRKCENLLSSYITGLSGMESIRVKKILSGGIRKCDCTQDEQEIYDCSDEIRSKLGNIVAMDNEILRNTKKERDKQQNKLKKLRKGININEYYE